MPRRVSRPRYSNLHKAELDDDLKRVKLAIEREKLCHLKVKTAQLPASLTGRYLRESGRNGAGAKGRGEDRNEGGDSEGEIFQHGLQLSLNKPDFLQALFQFRREQGCNDSEFLTGELAAQYGAHLDMLGL